MKKLAEFFRRHSLIIGIIWMFLLTWPIDLSNSGLLPLYFPFIVYLFLGWGFVFASIAMTWITLGKENVVALLKRFLIRRFGWKWYLTLLIIPTLIVLGISLNALLTHTPIDFSRAYAYTIFGTSANLALFIVPFLLIDAIANGEEIGWRGYALPRLQAKYNALVSALILGLVWGFWHLPKYLSHWDTVLFAWYMVDTVAKAILLTWLYNNTNGSLLLTTLCHAIWNTAGVFLPIATTVSNTNSSALMVIVVLEIVMAALIVLVAGPTHLSRTQIRQIQN